MKPLRIAHIAPFGPNLAGIYEAARDMVYADVLMGHEAWFVDVGAQLVGNPPTRLAPQVGAVDERGPWRLVTAPPSVCDAADVIVLHTGCPNEWLVWNQAPVVMIVHGTPVAAFRVEQRGPLHSYSVYAESSRWKRVKAMVYFWPEFRPYWDVVFPAGKSVVLDYPPVDRQRFTPQGAVFEIPRFQRGRYNGLIADSWREDSDILEITHGALEAAKRVQGLVWHITAITDPLGPFAILVKTLRGLGALGGIGARMQHFEQVYRAMDFTLSARRSISRVIAESLCCGTPVIAGRKCPAANYTVDTDEPYDVADAVQTLTARLDVDRAGLRAEALALSEQFDLALYGHAMTQLYERILKADVGG
jgi:glycosyltransferase involved in cell wall biosynthesis